MTTIIEKLETAHYVATEQQIELLAAEQYNGSTQAIRASGTYLRAIVAACQGKLGRKGRGRVNTQSQLAVLDAVHERFYPAVLRGVTTPDIASDETLDKAESGRRMLERNARSAFARTSVSTLRTYVAAGGDMRALILAEVTKHALRTALSPPEPRDKGARQMQRAEGALVRAAQRLAKRDPVAASRLLSKAIVTLQGVLEEVGGDAPQHGATTVAGVTTVAGGRSVQRTRVGVPMLHRPA
jgi:hypothetical protein